MGISLHANTQHRTVLIISLYQKLSTPQNLPYLKQSSVKCVDEIVDCYPQTDASDGTEQPASLFLVLCSILCPQWSAFGKPWSVTAETMQQRLPFFFFFFFFFKHFFLIKNTVFIMNARSRFNPSAIPNWHAACGPTKKTVVREKNKQNKKKFFSRIAHSWQSSTGPRLKVWYCHRPALFDCRLHSKIVDLYIYICQYIKSVS